MNHRHPGNFLTLIMSVVILFGFEKISWYFSGFLRQV